MIYYKQCFFEKGKSRQTSWIPEQFAHLGNYVKLQDKKGNWEDGWRITAVSHNTRSPEDQVIARSQDHKHQRKASDA